MRAETRARIAALRRAGVPAGLAERRALRRIFSTAPGAYSPSTQFANREGWSPERLNRLYERYHDKGVALVAINPDSPKSVRLDEMGYTDTDDSLSGMKARAMRVGFHPGVRVGSENP